VPTSSSCPATDSNPKHDLFDIVSVGKPSGRILISKYSFFWNEFGIQKERSTCHPNELVSDTEARLPENSINNSGCLIPDVTFETGKCVLAEYETRALCCYMAETAVVRKEVSGPEGCLSCIDKALCCFQDLAPIPGGVMAVLECCGIRILGPQKSKPVPGGFAAPWAKGGGGASATGANFGSAETPIAIVSNVTPNMVPQPLAML
jgi:hypothetical protein